MKAIIKPQENMMPCVLIELTDGDGGACFINVNHLVTMFESDLAVAGVGTTITLTGGTRARVNVRETLSKIVEKIEQANSPARNLCVDNSTGAQRLRGKSLENLQELERLLHEGERKAEAYGRAFGSASRGNERSNLGRYKAFIDSSPDEFPNIYQWLNRPRRASRHPSR